MNKRTFNLVSVTIPMTILLVFWLASPTSIQCQDAEFQAGLKKVEALLDLAERLQEEGAIDKAQQLLKQAQELKSRLAKFANERPRKNSSGELERILQGLKTGASSLRALDRGEEAKKLERLAEELQQKSKSGEKRRPGEKEQKAGQEQIKIMRIAMQGLLDAGREESAEMMEHAIHAQELSLKGVRNEKANKVYETAPNLGQCVELLMFAARKLRDAGKAEQAGVVANLGEQLKKRFRAEQNRSSEGPNGVKKREVATKREVAAEQIQVMRTALVALWEGERKEWAEVLNRAIQARIVRIEQVNGEKAKAVLEREPHLEQTLKSLGAAAELWRKFGHQKTRPTSEISPRGWRG